MDHFYRRDWNKKKDNKAALFLPENLAPQQQAQVGWDSLHNDKDKYKRQRQRQRTMKLVFYSKKIWLYSRRRLGGAVFTKTKSNTKTKSKTKKKTKKNKNKDKIR